MARMHAAAAAGGLPRRAPLSLEELQGVAITAEDFAGALLKVQPSVRREGFSTKPNVTWADVVRALAERLPQLDCAGGEAPSWALPAAV